MSFVYRFSQTPQSFSVISNLLIAVCYKFEQIGLFHIQIRILDSEFFEFFLELLPFLIGLLQERSISYTYSTYTEKSDGTGCLHFA